jgi:hypothetical protein
MPVPSAQWRMVRRAGKAETPGGWAGIARSVCDFTSIVNNGHPCRPRLLELAKALDSVGASLGMARVEREV